MMRAAFCDSRDVFLSAIIWIISYTWCQLVADSCCHLNVVIRLLSSSCCHLRAVIRQVSSQPDRRSIRPIIRTRKPVRRCVFVQPAVHNNRPCFSIRTVDLDKRETISAMCFPLNICTIAHKLRRGHLNMKILLI